MSGYLKKRKHTIDEVADIIRRGGDRVRHPKVPVVDPEGAL